MKNYVIFGDSAFAERIYKYIKQENVARVLCFTNEKRFINKDRIANLQVVPFEKLSEIYDKYTFEILICIGYSNMNTLRAKIYSMCKSMGFMIGTWISCTVTSYSNEISEGNIILPNCHIGPSCHIGICNIFEPCVCMTHDNKIGNFNFVSTDVTFGGNSVVHNHCFIGLNSTIKSSIEINDYSLIGSASNVLKSTIENGVYVGNPAHQLIGKNSFDIKI